MHSESIVGIGVDLVHVPRLARKIERRGDKLLHHVFTPAEIAAATRSGEFEMQRLAVWFAAKEATVKALGTGLIGEMSFADVEVQHELSGAPKILLTGETAEVARGRGVRSWHVSLSHEGDTAIAFIIATAGGT